MAIASSSPSSPSSSSSSSNVSVIPTGPQVFISFRGKELRKGFISFLVPALKKKNINVFIDEHEVRGKDLISLFRRIGESKIALVIFSEGYAESKWCLDELVQIKKCVDQKKIIAIPIFYKLDPAVVKGLKGKFGDKFRDLIERYHHEPERYQKWTEALTSVSRTFALCLPEHSDKSEKDFIRSIIKEVKKALSNISRERNGDREEIDDCFVVSERKLTTDMYDTPEVSTSTMRKVSSNNGVGVGTFKSQKPNFDDEDDDGDSLLKALIAKLVASLTSIVAAYAELQRAHSDAIQAAETVVVDVKTLSELIRSSNGGGGGSGSGSGSSLENQPRRSKVRKQVWAGVLGISSDSTIILECI
ncbi:putative TIR domain-containing protein [Arabidopsis thaliana]|nr:Toll/interleukin-1 receptor homology (TIR) domain superfamily [Arabidopsis thaliana x Arabidopsis arenosa]